MCFTCVLIKEEAEGASHSRYTEEDSPGQGLRRDPRGKHLLKNCWKKHPEKQPEHLKNKDKDKPKVDDPATEEAPPAPAQAQSNSASFKLSEESAGASAATAFAFMRGANPCSHT